MIGLQLPSFSWPGGALGIRLRLVDIARQADELGFHSLWVMDHVFQLPPQTGWNGPDQPMLEAYSTLGYLAGATSRVRLGRLSPAWSTARRGCLPSRSQPWTS